MAAAAAEEGFRDTWLESSTELLITAIKLGHVCAAEQLLLLDPRAGADMQRSDEMPAHVAATQPNSISVLQLLLAAAPDLLHATSTYTDELVAFETSGWTLMHGAASSGNVEAIRLLLQLAPELASTRNGDGEFPLHHAAPSNSPAAVQLLLQAAPRTAAAADSFGWTAAHFAAKRGRADNLQILLDAGVPGPEVSSTDSCLPLHLAARCAEGEAGAAAIGMLLTVYPAAAQVADHDGYLPLHHAAEFGSEAAVSQLLAAHPAAAGVADRNGMLPLHLAAQSEREAAVRRLLAAHPAAALVQDSQGRTPLHHAVMHTHTYMPYSVSAAVMLLAAHPAAALAQDGEGRTPLQVAIRHHRFEAASVLFPASGMSAAQVLDRCAALPNYLQSWLPPLFAALAAHLPLTPQQWQRLPTPCAGLGCALPAVLARSEAEAALLVAHLPPADAERLRTAALSLHRLQRRLQLELPAQLLGRMMALALADA